MVQLLAGVENFVTDNIIVLYLMCILPAIQREPAGIFVD
jgi:hypothetical protein